MTFRWFAGAVLSATVLLMIAGCGDGGFWGDWGADCSVGECNDEREFADEMADDADFDIAQQDEIGELAVGEEVTITGEVTDEYAAVSFDAESGAWYDVTVYSRGLPTPSFVVDATRFIDEWWSPIHDTGVADRSVATPHQGTHEIRIYSDHFSPSGQQPDTAPEGEEWDFVLHIERRESPEAKLLEPGEEYTFGVDDLRENLYRVDVDEDAAKVWLQIGAQQGASPLFLGGEGLDEIFDGPRVGLWVDATVEEGPLFLADYVHADQLNASYDVDVYQEEGFAIGASSEETYQLDAGEALIAHNVLDPADFVVHSMDIELARDGETVAAYEGGNANISSEFRGIAYVSEEGGEYTLTKTNSHNIPQTEVEFDIYTTSPDDFGVFEIPGEHNIPSTQDLGAEEEQLVEFELPENVVMDMEFDEFSGPAVRLFRRALPESEVFTFDGNSDPKALEAGTYYALIHGTTSTVEDGYNLVMDLTEAPEPFEHSEEIELDRTDVVYVFASMPFFREDGLELAVTIEGPDGVVFGPETTNDRMHVPVRSAGTYTVELEGSLWHEEIEAMPDIEMYSSQDLGELGPGDGPLEMFGDDEVSDYETFVFELDEPSWVVWSAFGDDSASNSYPRVEFFELGDPSPQLVPGYEGAKADSLTSGEYIVFADYSDAGSLDDQQATMTVDRLPDVVETIDANAGLPPEDEPPGMLSLDIDNCGQASHVAVQIEYELEGTPRPIIEVESPEGERVRLWDGDSVRPEDRSPMTFPDDTVSHESTQPLTGQADGTWQLHLWHDSSLTTNSTLDKWGLKLWCQ